MAPRRGPPSRTRAATFEAGRWMARRGAPLSARASASSSELELADPAGLARAKERLASGQVLVASTYIDGWKYRAISDDPSTLDDDAQVGKQACTHATITSSAYHVLTIVGYDDRICVSRTPPPPLPSTAAPSSSSSGRATRRRHSRCWSSRSTRRRRRAWTSPRHHRRGVYAGMPTTRRRSDCRSRCSAAKGNSSLSACRVRRARRTR